MKSVSLSVALALVAFSAHADSRVAGVPSDLVLVESSGPYRILAFRACSPEHCWNEFFAQELSDAPTPRVVCTHPIAELNEISDAVLRSATWREDPDFVLVDLAIRHGKTYRQRPKLGWSLYAK